MEAQGNDLQTIPVMNITEITNKFTDDQFLSSVGVEASRQAVSFINEYKFDGTLVSFFCYNFIL